MINRILRYSLIFVLLIILQLFLFSNIQFSGYVNPFVYVMFIMLLPFEIPSWLLLIISFLTGMVVDIFTGTPGMHAAATVMAGFSRPFVLRLIAPRDGYEASSEPSLLVYGFRWFFLYSLFIVFNHHFILFYVEVFRLADFFNTFLRVLLSTCFSVIFIMLLEFMRRGK
ncbi:MAG TPA: rod shape-determining protein MreD [Bacteroidales bacterium]|nr:rod shape-determining protein MreD [Bacteroidales bacterium]